MPTILSSSAKRNGGLNDIGNLHEKSVQVGKDRKRSKAVYAFRKTSNAFR